VDPVQRIFLKLRAADPYHVYLIGKEQGAFSPGQGGPQIRPFPGEGKEFFCQPFLFRFGPQSVKITVIASEKEFVAGREHSLKELQFFCCGQVCHVLPSDQKNIRLGGGFISYFRFYFS
jgi:hypothetical protein